MRWLAGKRNTLRLSIVLSVVLLLTTTLPVVQDKARRGDVILDTLAATEISATEVSSDYMNYSSVEQNSAENNIREIVNEIDQIVNNITFGFIVEDHSNNDGEIEYLYSELNENIDSVTIFKQFGLDSNRFVTDDELGFINQHNLHLVVTWEPWNPLEGVEQSVDYLGQIPRSIHDDYIRSFGNYIKEYEKPVTVRFAHEMNGDWYPWGNRSDEYTAAYRHINKLFSEIGVNNVIWEWSVNAQSVPYQPAEQVSAYYPGDNFVDTVGISGYNFGGSRWISFEDIFDSMYFHLSYSFANKPIYLSEVGSSEIGGDKVKWVEEMFATLNSKKYNNLVGLTWFSLNKENDWRVNSSMEVFNVFKHNLSK